MRLRRTAAAVGLLVAALAPAACSDLLAESEDVVVRLEAADRAAVRRVRQDVLAAAPDFGGVRVGEQTVDTGSSALVFSLPGDRLDIALGLLERLDAEVVETDIDVDVRQLERDAADAPSTDDTGRRGAAGADDGIVRLRVEVEERAGTGLEGALRALMALFSVVGVVATARWARERLGGTPPGAPPRRTPGPPRRPSDGGDAAGPTGVVSAPPRGASPAELSAPSPSRWTPRGPSWRAGRTVRQRNQGAGEPPTPWS